MKIFYCTKSFLLFTIVVFLSKPCKSQNLTDVGKQKPFSITGGMNLFGGFYTASGISEVGRGQTSPYGISGNINLSIYGFQMPFSFTLGNQGQSYRQPFNMIGVSPTYKWIKLHAGYRNITFSPFTLAGHTFLGAGIELNPGYLRVGAMYGKFNKAIESNLANPDILPAFGRTGYAAKVGVGKSNNYIDLILFRASDDVASVANTLDASNILPSDNLALGISSKLSIVKNLTIDLDWTGSIINRDSRATELTSDVKIVNQIKSLGLFTPRISSQFFIARQAGLNYRNKTWGLRFLWKKIDPDYKTMGAYFFQNDIESYTLAPNINLANGKLRLSGSFGVQTDNLKNQKRSTSDRNIGSLVVSWNPSQSFGWDFQFSNYGISQKAGLRPIIDTLRIAQNNRTIGSNVRFSKFGEKASHNITLSGMMQDLADLNSKTANFTQNTNINLNVSYLYQNLISNLGLTGILTYTITKLPNNQELLFYGPTLGVNKSFANNKIQTSANFGYLLNKQEGVSGKVLNGSANASYAFLPKHNISFLMNYLNSDTGNPAQSFNELRGTVGYGISF